MIEKLLTSDKNCLLCERSKRVVGNIRMYDIRFMIVILQRFKPELNVIVLLYYFSIDCLNMRSLRIF